MKKKLLAILLSAAMVLSLMACGAKEEAPAAEAPAATEEAEAPAEEPAAEPEAVPFSADFAYVEDDGTTFDIAILQ